MHNSYIRFENNQEPASNSHENNQGENKIRASSGFGTIGDSSGPQLNAEQAPPGPQHAAVSNNQDNVSYSEISMSRMAHSQGARVSAAPMSSSKKTNKEEINCKKCPTCKIVKTPRVYHCSICDCCISVHDHHCPWVGTCIGQRNHRSFLMYGIVT